MKQKKYFIEVWGCQMNEHDSETLRGLIEKKGYIKCDDPLSSDLVVLYTCCIREKAEDKVLGRLGSLCKHKRVKNANMKIAIGGCMVQQEDVASNIINKFREVDIVFGTHNLSFFDELLDSSNGDKRIKEVLDTKEVIIKENVPIKRDSDLKAYVNIIYGCNNYCSYCIVPYVRGREKSRQIDDIVKEVETLLKDGYKEITLLGQNVNSYGKDLDENIDFVTLLKRLDDLGEYRLRFMSSHPRDFNFELLDFIKESKNVCPQFHLPLQSGSSNIIKLMNRGYTKEHYLEIVNYIKANFDDYTISTDIIVGFPMETEEDFKDTLDVVDNVGFDQAYMFIYSVREGTRAEKMEGHIAEDVKKDRFYRLKKLQDSKSKERNKSNLGKIVEVLVDEKASNGYLTGRTKSNRIVHFKGDDFLYGEIVKVKIIDNTSFTLTGELIEKE